MRNKRIIIIFSILVFLALIVVLSSVLFKIDSLDVVCSTSPVLNIEKSEAEINLKHYKGTSIFFLNEKKLANKLESDFPNIKVVNVERKFPKNVIVTIQERIEVYCFNIDDKYVYTDYNCKVLRISDKKEEIYINSCGQAIDVKINDIELKSITASDYKLGEIINFTSYGITKFLTELFLKTTNDSIFFRKYIHSVDLKYLIVTGSQAEIKMKTGAKFTFYRTLEYSEKFILYMNKFMENDLDISLEVDRINGDYVIEHINNKYLISGQPIYNS